MRGFFYFARGASSKFYPKFKICDADAERALHRRRFRCRISNFTLHLLPSIHRFRVLKVKFQNLIAESTACGIYAVISVSIRAGRGCDVTFLAGAAAAAPHCSARLQNPLQRYMGELRSR